MKVFSSLDNELSLNIFSFKDIQRASDIISSPSASLQDAELILEYLEELKKSPAVVSTSDDKTKYSPVYDAKYHSKEAIEAYIARLSGTYVKLSNPKHFVCQMGLFHEVVGTDKVAVDIHASTAFSTQSAADGQGSMVWITIAAGNVLPDVLLKLSSSVMTSYGLDIHRAHLDIVKDDSIAIPDLPQTGHVTLLRLLVDPLEKTERNLLQIDGKERLQLIQDLTRAKWLDENVYELGLDKHPHLGLKKAEVIVALCSLLHGPLSKINGQAYASVRTILQLLENGKPTAHIAVAESIVDLFLDRFQPVTTEPGVVVSKLTNDEFQQRYTVIANTIQHLQHEPARVLLAKMLEALPLILRTNYYLPDRYALSFRLAPAVMANPAQAAAPFGILFAHGRHFNGFHCRFRDIARGGLRIVTPSSRDLYNHESARHFDEAYGLSYAQQLKNKDIPEGGSKAVILVNSPAIPPAKKAFSVRKSVKAFIDSLLDLIVKDTVSKCVDLYGKDEIIYLGPDEQVIPYDIDWIILRAGQRGYPIPAAFMSSKKGAGINHKQYGVTSEGIVVFLEVALKNVLGIDPRKQPFTIKLTGGPDGDVAGNLILILYREYGANCKIVGIADGFGVAEDPNGLDSEELVRLVRASLPITSYNKTKLSNTGILLDASTEEGVARRAALPFKVKSDAFVPAGGRPNTINGENWKQYLDEATGKPSSPLIVEGANIFNTPEAREMLFKHGGVVIVKDSSANKVSVPI